MPDLQAYLSGPDLHISISGGIVALLLLILHRNQRADIVTDTLFKRIDELEQTLLEQMRR